MIIFINWVIFNTLVLQSYSVLVNWTLSFLSFLWCLLFYFNSTFKILDFFNTSIDIIEPLLFKFNLLSFFVINVLKVLYLSDVIFGAKSMLMLDF